MSTACRDGILPINVGINRKWQDTSSAVAVISIKLRSRGDKSARCYQFQLWRSEVKGQGRMCPLFIRNIAVQNCIKIMTSSFQIIGNSLYRSKVKIKCGQSPINSKVHYNTHAYQVTRVFDHQWFFSSFCATRKKHTDRYTVKVKAIPAYSA